MPEGVTDDKIMEGTISFTKIGQNSANPGQVMKWNGASWEPSDDYGVAGPLTEIFAIDGLTGGGSQGAVTVGIDFEGVTEDKLAPGSVNGDKIQSQTISFDNIAQNSAEAGQIMKWNGSGWIPDNDSTGSGGITVGTTVSGNTTGSVLQVVNTHTGAGQSSYAIEGQSMHNTFNDPYHYGVYGLVGNGANPFYDPFISHAGVFGGATEAGKQHLHGVVGTSHQGCGIYGYSVEGYAGYFNGPVKIEGGTVINGSLVVPGGQAGIGTPSPSRMLDVESSEAIDGIDINNTGDDGDPVIRYQLSGSTLFSLGIDDGDSDKFKIGTSSLGSNTAFTIDNLQNVGIGTVNPDEKLHINGRIKIVDGNVGVNKVLTSDLNGVGTWQDLPASIGGTGTSDYLPKFSNSTTLTSSIIYEGGSKGSGKDNSGNSNTDMENSGDIEKGGKAKDINIGIGTTTPKNKLDVEGSAAIGVSYSGTSAAPSNGLIVEGSVGIGTTSPQNKLDIEGSVVVGSTYSGTSTASTNGLLVEGETGIGTNDPDGKLHVVNTSDTTSFRVDDVEFDSSPFIVNKNGRVGIGTENPGSKLHVEGTIEVDQKIMANDIGGLEFATSDGTSHLFMDNSGLFGIGTSSPSASLEIETSYSSDGLCINNTFSDGDPYVRFQLSGSSKFTMGVDDSDGDKLKIGTTAVSTSTSLTINSSGNVGIKETSPTAKLHVEQTASADAFRVDDTSDDSTPFIIKSDGKVGIGTTTPTQKLDVSGTIKATSYVGDGSGLTGIGTGTGGVINTGSTTIGADSDANGSGEIALQTRGLTRMTIKNDGIVECTVLKLTGGGDIAEPFDITNNTIVEPGMVMSIDPENQGKLKLSDRAYDKCVAGVISGANNVNPGLVLEQEGTMASGEHPVALTGRVYCLAETSNGQIKPGDLLTTSEIPGYAMKVHDYDMARGAIIGKAMSSLKEDKGLVFILVTLQ